MVRKAVLCSQFVLMKRTFHIAVPPGTEALDGVLLCDLSHHHACIARADAHTRKIVQLSYYQLGSGLEPRTLEQLLNAEGITSTTVSRVVVNNGMGEAVLVPLPHFSEKAGKRFHAATFGATSDAFFFDHMVKENLVVVHAVPQDIMGVLKRLGATEVSHAYGCWLRSLHGPLAGEGVAVHVNASEVSVLAKGAEQLKLVQTYRYAAPMDVVYYLLAVCRQYSLSQTDTPLLLSGMVSEDSAVHAELRQYFANVGFWSPAEDNFVQTDYPAHFFSFIHNLAACAL